MHAKLISCLSSSWLSQIRYTLFELEPALAMFGLRHHWTWFHSDVVIDSTLFNLARILSLSASTDKRLEIIFCCTTPRSHTYDVNLTLVAFEFGHCSLLQLRFGIEFQCMWIRCKWEWHSHKQVCTQQLLESAEVPHARTECRRLPPPIEFTRMNRS